MSAKENRDTKQRAARRKVALACLSCRDKKIRCDGNKPICGPCQRRSYRLEQCIYDTENTRAASRDEYIATLHQRIRELENDHSRAGAPVQPLSQPSQNESPTQHNSSGVRMVSPSSAIALQSVRESVERDRYSTHSGAADQQRIENPTSTTSCHGDTTPSYESLVFGDNVEGNITGMGQIAAPGDDRGTKSAQLQFYGWSSTASFMRLARESIPLLQSSATGSQSLPSSRSETSSKSSIDEFLLPPRELADHLLNCFWDRVYVLYPFIHRPSFEAAYRNIWRAQDEPKTTLLDLEIGLGSRTDSGPKSMVFYSALNVMLGLGCHFADLPPENKETLSSSFFDRAKTLIGIDLLDINTLGVVQTLLTTALYLQGSPFPTRCWNTIGLACRVALGQGLHESNLPVSLTPLERDIRQRTWHACVMIDITVSMTHGRPSMTTHLAPVPPPNDPETSLISGGDGQPSLMTFYVASIELYGILDRILGDVYQAWRGRRREDQPLLNSMGSLDTILGIERQLVVYESNVPSFLSWTDRLSAMSTDGEAGRTIALQRNVLHARFIHLRLLLYRPIFTQLYTETIRRREPTRTAEQGPATVADRIVTQSTLYSSMSSKCAAACVMAAIDLTHKVYETYQTSSADSWWYNAFYVSNAAIVLLMSLSAPSLLDLITVNQARDAWHEATTILGYMATFSHAASNTLQFLQAAYNHVVTVDVAIPGAANKQQPPNKDHRATNTPLDTSPANAEAENFRIPMDAPFSFFNWEDVPPNIAPGLDGGGFVTRIDFSDLLR